MTTSPVLDAVPVGENAVLVEVADTGTAHGVAAWARSRGPRCVDVVPAARTVLLDGVDDVSATIERLRALDHGDLPAPVRSDETVVIPVVYDGADLEAVARHWACDVDEVVARHTSVSFLADFCGFSPGFAYLSGMRPEWAVPRLTTPRPRVPAGSVALADAWCGVYPTASPGGWLLLGHTDVAVFDLDRVDSPALLVPGTRVRFVAA